MTDNATLTFRERYERMWKRTATITHTLCNNDVLENVVLFHAPLALAFVIQMMYLSDKRWSVCSLKYIKSYDWLETELDNNRMRSSSQEWYVWRPTRTLLDLTEDILWLDERYKPSGNNLLFLHYTLYRVNYTGTWSDPYTWTPLETITASYLNMKYIQEDVLDKTFEEQCESYNINSAYMKLASDAIETHTATSDDIVSQFHDMNAEISDEWEESEELQGDYLCGDPLLPHIVAPDPDVDVEDVLEANVEEDEDKYD